LLALHAACGRIQYDPLFDAGQDGRAVDDAALDAGAPVDEGTVLDEGTPFDAEVPVDGPSCARPAATAVCPRRPLIDGRLECGLVVAPLVPLAWTGDDPIPAAHRTELAIAWHPDGIYFFVHVVTSVLRPPDATDPVYCGDGVDLYLDADALFTAAPRYDAPGTRQFIISAPIGTTSTRAVTYMDSRDDGVWDVGRAVAVRTADGYVVEAFVTQEDLRLPPGAFLDDATVAIDVSLNVAGAVDAPIECGRRLGEYHLSIAPLPAGCVVPYCSVLAFCTPKLLSDR
jgi:hypothetical protein